LIFLPPTDSGLPAPDETAVARTLAFSFLGFLASLLPRLLLPLDIVFSFGSKHRATHATRTVSRWKIRVA